MITLSQVTPFFEAGIGLGLAYSVLSEFSALGPQSAKQKLEKLILHYPGSATEPADQKHRDQIFKIRTRLLTLERRRRGFRNLLSLLSIAAAVWNVVLLFLIGMDPAWSVTTACYLVLSAAVFYPILAASLEFGTWHYAARKHLAQIADLEAAQRADAFVGA